MFGSFHIFSYQLNTLKTVEMIVDFRRNPPALPPLTIMNNSVNAVESFRFLGTTISQDLKWDTHIDSIMKKAQQRMYFLRQLKKFNLPQAQSFLKTTTNSSCVCTHLANKADSDSDIYCKLYDVW